MEQCRHRDKYCHPPFTVPSGSVVVYASLVLRLSSEALVVKVLHLLQSLSPPPCRRLSTAPSTMAFGFASLSTRPLAPTSNTSSGTIKPSPLDKLAVELLTLIAFYACTDGGPTGCALALVSKRVRAASGDADVPHPTGQPPHNQVAPDHHHSPLILPASSSTVFSSPAGSSALSHSGIKKRKSDVIDLTSDGPGETLDCVSMFRALYSLSTSH